MTKKDGKVGVWVAELERFGYSLRTVGRTEKECRDAMSAEYIKTYAIYNGSFDMEDEEDKEYYDYAMDEIYCDFIPYGKVVWG